MPPTTKVTVPLEAKLNLQTRCGPGSWYQFNYGVSSNIWQQSQIRQFGNFILKNLEILFEKFGNFIWKFLKIIWKIWKILFEKFGKIEKKGSCAKLPDWDLLATKFMYTWLKELLFNLKDFLMFFIKFSNFSNAIFHIFNQPTFQILEKALAEGFDRPLVH